MWSLRIVDKHRGGSLRAAHQTGEPDHRRDSSADQEPNGFVGGFAGEEPREVAAYGIGRDEPENEQDDADDQKNDGDEFTQTMFRPGWESVSNDFATTDDTHQDQYDGDDQKDVDESADGVGRNESQQPEDQKDDGDRVEHVL